MTLGLKNNIVTETYKNITVDTPIASGKIVQNNEHITDLNDDLGGLPQLEQFYQTLVFRQKYDTTYSFSSVSEFKNTEPYPEDVIENPSQATKYSILERIDDIKDSDGPYVFKVRMTSYDSVSKPTTLIDRSETWKDVIVFSQGFNPLYGPVTKRGVRATVLHSTGAFRSSLKMDCLKWSYSSPSNFMMDFGTYGSSERYYGIGYCGSGQYRYFRLQSYLETGNTTDYILYNEPIIELYVISRNNYQRPYMENDSITTPLQGTTIFNLKYI